MARGYPSMTALLGLLAVLGYQNRDKIGEILGGLGKSGDPNQKEQGGLGGLLDTLAKQTGLSRDELLDRLTRELPQAVDKFTPQGRVPTESEMSRSVGA